MALGTNMISPKLHADGVNFENIAYAIMCCYF